MTSVNNFIHHLDDKRKYLVYLLQTIELGEGYGENDSIMLTFLYGSNLPVV